jgi:hypothetical protein
MSTARIDQIPTRRSFIPNGAIIRAMESPDTGGRLDITFSSDAIHTRLNALAPRQGLWFEGPATGGRSASGTIPAAIGTSDVSVAFSMLVPPSTPATNIGIFFIGSGTEVVNSPYSFHVYLRSAGNLAIGLRGAAPLTEALVEVVDGFFTNYGGTFVNVVITRSGATVKCYINGVLQSFGTPLTAGTPPAWSDAFEGTGLVIGRYGVTTAFLTNAAISSLALYNFAIPATTTSGVVGVAERYADGVWVRAGERGLAVNTIVNGTFETNTTGWLFEGNHSTSTRDTADPITGVGSLKIIASGAVDSATNRVRASGSTRNVALSYRVSFKAKTLSGNTSLRIFHNGIGPTDTGAFGVTLTGSAETYTGIVPPSAVGGSWLLGLGDAGEALIDDFEAIPYASTLDLQPQGIGRTIIDRSANRNHATVAGTTLPIYLQPTDGGKIVTRTALGSFAQLTGLAVFDAASRYRIRSWVVTAAANCTISLSNANSGAVYVSGLALTAGVPTDVTLLTRIATTANLWCTCNVADPVTHVIEYERISD